MKKKKMVGRRVMEGGKEGGEWRVVKRGVSGEW